MRSSERSALRSELRFHLDESVDPAIARGLRAHGIDVTTTVDVGLRTASDREQWDFIRSTRRVMVTHDADFLRIARAEHEHPGIAYCGLGRRSLGEMLRTLRMMVENLEPRDMDGRIQFL